MKRGFILTESILILFLLGFLTTITFYQSVSRSDIRRYEHRIFEKNDQLLNNRFRSCPVCIVKEKNSGEKE